VKNIFYITNIFPYYRKPIWELLLNEKTYNFHFYYSNQNLNGIKAVNNIKNEKLHLIKNYFFLGRIIWQKGVIQEIIKKRPDKIILFGEMNVISNWLIAILSKYLKIEVIFWGHGLYGNEKWFKKFLRVAFLKLADKHLLYSERAKGIMIKNGFNSSNLFVVYNSLDFEKQNRHYQKLKNSLKDQENEDLKLIFIGRLTKIKRLDILIKAIKKTKKDIELNIIGEGEEKKNLIVLVKKYDLQKINFLGEIFDEDVISEKIFFSDLCVSPGNVGLTAIHSLTYGTPVLTHDNFNFQMPEAEAIKENVSGVFFRIDDTNDLSEKIKTFKKYNFNKSKVREIVLNKYNPNYQKTIFDKIILQ